MVISMDKNGLGYLELSDSARESCAGNRFTGCYNVKFGGEKGSAVKVTENRVAYNTKQATSTKSFLAGGAAIKWKNRLSNGTYLWAVEGTRSGGKTVSL